MLVDREMLRGLVTKKVVDNDGQLALLVIVINLIHTRGTATISTTEVVQQRTSEIVVGGCTDPSVHEAVVEVLQGLQKKGHVQISNDRVALTQTGSEIINREVERRR